MKTLLLTTTALILAGEAMAADMPLKARPAPLAFSWTGFSAGVHLGTDWGRASFRDPNADAATLIAPAGGTINDLEHTGVLGGVQLGYDYQFAPHWVVGVGGDFSWTNLEGQVDDPFFGGKSPILGVSPMPITAKTDWVASMTARFGYAFDRFLVYTKGGVAWSHNTYGVQNHVGWGNPGFICISGATPIACNPTGTDTRTGVTVGVGGEWAFADHWAAGIEYDHYDFGRTNVILTDPNVFLFAGVSQSAPISIKQTIETAKFTLSYRFDPRW